MVPMTSVASELPDAASLKKLKVADLKALLEARGVLDTSGKKDALVGRLEATRGIPPAAASPDDDADAEDDETPGATETATEAAPAPASDPPKPLALHVSEAKTIAQGGGDASGAGAGPKIYVGCVRPNSVP